MVAFIFDDVLHGKRISEIVRELNREGVGGHQGKGRGETGLRDILTNEVYSGTLGWGYTSEGGLEPVRVENACLAITDQEIFGKVQEQLRECGMVGDTGLEPVTSCVLVRGFTTSSSCSVLSRITQ